MKTELRNYRKMAIVGLAFTLAFTTPTLANNGDKENPTTELKFIGNMENQPVFELNLTDKEDEYTVIFRDDLGNILYNEKFKGTGLSKKFMLKADEIVDTAVNVEVKSKKNNASEVYAIVETSVTLKKP